MNLDWLCRHCRLGLVDIRGSKVEGGFVLELRVDRGG